MRFSTGNHIHHKHDDDIDGKVSSISITKVAVSEDGEKDR